MWKVVEKYREHMYKFMNFIFQKQYNKFVNYKNENLGVQTCTC